MVPLRFVAESFGIDVQYDATSKMITLTYVSYTTPVVQLPSAPTLISPVTNSTLIILILHSLGQLFLGLIITSCK